MPALFYKHSHNVMAESFYFVLDSNHEATLCVHAQSVCHSRHLSNDEQTLKKTHNRPERDAKGGTKALAKRRKARAQT